MNVRRATLLSRFLKIHRQDKIKFMYTICKDFHLCIAMPWIHVLVVSLMILLHIYYFFLSFSLLHLFFYLAYIFSISIPIWIFVPWRKRFKKYVKIFLSFNIIHNKRRFHITSSYLNTFYPIFDSKSSLVLTSKNFLKNFNYLKNYLKDSLWLVVFKLWSAIH